MSKTTVTYMLYMYADQPAPGVGYCCTKKEFSNYEEAKSMGKTCGCQMFEIQGISTTVTEPSKKNPQGSVETSKYIMDRETNYPATWTKPKPPELRWNIYPTKNGGSGGYMRLRLASEADAMKVLALTGKCGQGFCFVLGKRENIMWAKTISGQQQTMKLLQKAGYIDPKQWI